MKFKAGDKVWAISFARHDENPAAGEYAGVIEDFFCMEDGVEFYGVDIPSLPSHDGGWIISEKCLRPRDDGDYPELPGLSDETPQGKSSWDSFELRKPRELDVTA